MPPATSLGRLAPVAFVLLWSSGWVAAEFGAMVSGPLTFLVIRYAVAGVFFVAIAVLSGARWPSRRSELGHTLLSGVLLHGGYLGAVWWAIGQGVPAGISGIIAGLQPLLTALVAPYVLGERLSRLQRIGLVLGFLGVALAVLPKLLHAGSGGIPWFPVLVNVLGMVSVTSGTIYQKRYLQKIDIRVAATLQYLAALVVTVPFAFLLETFHVELGWQFLAVLAWSVLGTSVAAILLLLYLLSHGQVSRVASLVYLVPPLAALQAFVFLGEALTALTIAGTAIVVAGVYLANYKGKQPAAAPPPPAQ
ncbi:DMT family transporter [Dongia sedimenti]|uniref:DMT family transporter n=1 Tax=Dongia sedimenti TaxID=3064282 RepID=A0ABU0YUS1_9PROT|nr:DMT family transporter [Rhodospirillaceae bacterium R-7]